MKKIQRLTLFLALFALCACSGQTDKLDVPTAVKDHAPVENLSWWSRAAMDALMRYSVWSGARSGYIAMFARDGVPIYSNATGWKDIESKQAMSVDTQIRIASMTKPITAVVAMMLVEEGRLKLDDPVSLYLPQFAQLLVATSNKANADGSYSTEPAKTVLRIKHLLMFASGIGPGREQGSTLVDYWNDNGIYQQKQGTLSERVSRLPRLPLLEEPGTRWRYGYSADVLASVIEKITSEDLATNMKARIFDPLGMRHTRYLPPSGDRENLATIYTQDEHENLVPASLTFNATWTPGGGGLVSTAADYMRFALMLWNGGEYQGVRILQRATIENMRTLHVPNGVLAAEGIDGMGWGLGMAVVADEEATITPDRNGDFWWAGYFGTTFFVSPATGLVGVILTQNKPNEYSGDPVALYVVQGLAFLGL